MEIPKHIKYLSFLFYLNAAIAAIIGGIGLISAYNSPIARAENINNPYSDLSRVVMDFGLSILSTSVAILVLIFLGVSLRKLKPWARTVTLVFGIVTIILGLINLVLGENNISYHFFVQIYAVWILFRPDVKEAFGITKKNDPIQNKPG